MTRPTPWHAAKRNDVHSEVFQTIQTIRAQQATQRDDVMSYLDLYSAGNITGLGDRYGNIQEQLGEYMYGSGANTRFNLCAAMVDTALSLIAQAPVVPKVLTTNGDFGIIRRAERRTQVLQGQMDKDTQETIKRGFLDAAKVGTGILHGYLDPTTGLPSTERVHMLEMYVEHLDGLYMKPRSVHRMRFVPREVLKAQFPKQATMIETAPGASYDSVTRFLLSGIKGRHDDFVEVVESHHLRRGPKHKGRHTITVPSVTLLDEDYQHDIHPYVFLRYRERDFGMWGAGLVESCKQAQNRINELVRRVSRSQDLASNLVVMVPSESNVRREEITNEMGLILKYDGPQPPTTVKWEGTLDDLQQQIDLEYQRALLVEGLSQEQVNGQGAGRGLESGVAVRAADDVQSRRLMPMMARFQQSCLEVARLYERLNDDAADEDPNFSISGQIKAGARTFLRTSKWAELAIPVGHAQVTMSQMSALPTTPAGRWAAAMDWIQSGFISKQYALDLMGMPDLDAFASIENAHIDMAQWQCEQILDGFDVEPLPRQNLAIAIDLATRAELQAMIMGADAETIDRFEAFLTYASALQAKAAAPAPGAMPAGPMPTPVAGGAPQPQLTPGLALAPPAA